jgi:hypothetical protein
MKLQLALTRSLESGLHNYIWTLETNVYPAQNFMKLCKLVDHVIRNNLYFKSGD